MVSVWLEVPLMQHNFGDVTLFGRCQKMLLFGLGFVR